jgi:uncharacterized protein (TIGR02145 family)
MRGLLLGVACFLSVSMSVTMSAQADINDYMNAQVTGTEIFMEYDHQKMLDEIDALTTQNDALTTQNDALTTQLANALDACSNLATVTYGVDTYDLVAIGDQCWFAENLRTTVYADGSPIPEVTGNSAWAGLSTGARCDYGNNANNVATYGRLYNWYAVNTGNLCPSGWHEPTDLEYTTLADFLGGEPVAGSKLKSSACDSPSWDGTNTSGFSGLAGGFRNSSGVFSLEGSYGYFWSASALGTDAWFRLLNGGLTGVLRNNLNQRLGFSVRCVRD